MLALKARWCPCTSTVSALFRELRAVVVSVNPPVSTLVEPASAFGTHALYDPEKARSDARQHFAVQLRVGSEIVREAADLLLRAFRSSDAAILDVAAIGHFYRSLIVAADGCLLCLEAGAAEQALVHARTAFEAGLQLEWLLKADRESRAKRFYVRHLREERSWYLRAIAGTHEHEEQTEAYAAEGDPGPPLDPEENRILVDLTNTELASEAYSEVNEWFDEVRAKQLAKGHRAHEPKWYSVGPGGKANLSALANDLNRRTDYRTTYRYLSYAVHSASLGASVRVRSSQLTIEHIRIPRHFSFAFSTAFLQLLRGSFQIVEIYRPDEKQRFVQRVRGEWLPVVGTSVDVQVSDSSESSGV